MILQFGNRHDVHDCRRDVNSFALSSAKVAEKGGVVRAKILCLSVALELRV